MTTLPALVLARAGTKAWDVNKFCVLWTVVIMGSAITLLGSALVRLPISELVASGRSVPMTVPIKDSAI